MKHIPVIDSLRGIAAIMVCLFHFIVSNSLFEQESLVSFFSWGKFGVQVFFVISGVVITLSLQKSHYRIQKFWSYLLKRIIRLEPPYLVSLLLAIVYIYVRELVPGATAVDLRPGLGEVLLHLGYLVSFFDNLRWVNPVYWTLAIEFQFYLFMGLLGPVLFLSRWWRMILIAVGLAVPVLAPGVGHLFTWLPLFYLGIAVAFKLLGQVSTWEFALLIICCSLSIFITLGYADLTVGMATALIILLFPAFQNAIGAFLGRISYSLYLLHAITGAVFINMMSNYTESDLLKVLLVVLGLLFSIVVSYVFHKWVEEPSLLKSKKVRLKQSEEQLIAK